MLKSVLTGITSIKENLLSLKSKIASTAVGAITVLVMLFGFTPAASAAPWVYVTNTNPSSPLSAVTFTGNISVGCTAGTPIVTFDGSLSASKNSTFSSFKVSGGLNGSLVGSPDAFQTNLVNYHYTKVVAAPVTTSDTIFLVVSEPNPGWYVLAKVQTFPCASPNTPSKIVGTVYKGYTLFYDAAYQA